MFLNWFTFLLIMRWLTSISWAYEICLWLPLKPLSPHKVIIHVGKTGSHQVSGSLKAEQEANKAATLTAELVISVRWEVDLTAPAGAKHFRSRLCISIWMWDYLMHWNWLEKNYPAVRKDAKSEPVGGCLFVLKVPQVTRPQCLKKCVATQDGRHWIFTG